MRDLQHPREDEIYFLYYSLFPYFFRGVVKKGCTLAYDTFRKRGIVFIYMLFRKKRDIESMPGQIWT